MKVVAIVSGGMDSVTLAHHLAREQHDVSMLSIDYGQRHRKEIDFAVSCAKRLGVAHEIADLSPILPLLAGSSLTSDAIDVPEGHYAEESMKATVVPNRNMLLLSVAASWAVSIKADAVAYGAHDGDHAIYPDCRPAFADAMAAAFSLCDWSPIQLLRPFLGMDKAAIVRLGAAIGVPYAETWSCYKGQGLHCGKCGTCVERIEAFTLAKVDDPTVYQERMAGV